MRNHKMLIPYVKLDHTIKYGIIRVAPQHFCICVITQLYNEAHL